MKKLLAKIRKILRDRRTRRLLTRVISITAAIVVFVTTYALVLPAITMELEAKCGIPAHQHDGSCYEEALVCELEETEGHNHSDDCYSTKLELDCKIEEHQHDADCYDEDGNLACSLVEHIHSVDNGCYKEARELTCEIPESDGHQHDSSCCEKVLKCGKEVHTHSAACYENTSSGVTVDAEDAAVEISSGAASTGVATTSTGASSVSDTTISVDNDDNGSIESTGTAATEDATTALTIVDNAEAGVTADGHYVPELNPVDFSTVLNSHTGIYYHAVKDGETVEDSTQIGFNGWNRIDDHTELGKVDLLRVYLAYSIPAGALNPTNPVARYRLPSNLHLTDAQVNTINTTVNGIAGGYVNMDTLEILDTEKYYAYLGIEAVEGTRKPSDDPDEYLADISRKAGTEASEYISATVRVENVYDEHSGELTEQDLVFTWTPYSIEKNQHEYDSTGTPTKAGEKIEGWLTLDFNMSQVDFSDPDITTFEREIENETDQAVDEDETGKTGVVEETVQRSEQTADVVFVEEGRDENNKKIHEISTSLTVVEESVTDFHAIHAIDKDETFADDQNALQDDAVSDGKAEEDNTVEAQEHVDEHSESETGKSSEEWNEQSADEREEEPEVEFEDGSLEAEGTGYKISLNYKADAQIPANAYLHVTEITRESDAEAYEACLEEAGNSVTDGKTTVDEKASRFFDIEILVDETQKSALESIGMDIPAEEQDNSEEDADSLVSENSGVTIRKIEPAAPVSVNIQLFDTETPDSKDEFEADNYKVIHFAENGLEEMQDVAASPLNTEEENIDPDIDLTDAATEIQFTAEQFSIYGLVYTVDFSYEINGKTYEFSLPGGGFVSLQRLVELLGIAGESAGVQDGDVEAEMISDSEQDPEEVVEEESDEAALLNSVEISEAAKKFVEDVELVEFSSPDLLWVGKVEESTTVGALREARKIESRYSAGLTEDQIAEIDSQSLNAGDWAFISLLPFDTLETLTIRMKTDETWMIRVTDAQTANKPGEVDTVDNIAEGLKITLFDYGPEKLDNVGNTYNSTDNSGINAGHTLKFYSYGTTGTTINNFTDGAYANQGIVLPNLDANGYPLLTTNPTESLKYLFDENNISGGAKTTYQDVNHLFQRDADGYLFYDSDRNYAYYNQSSHNFTVYENTYWEEGADSDNPFGIGFFPFNDYDQRYQCIHGNNFNWGCKGSKDRNVRDQVGHYNHHFGMKMEGTFMMPEDKKVNGKDIVYNFSGDDDMWLFVDGVLVLDIGGIHNPVSGTVNFTTGEVTVSKVKTAAGCSSSALGAKTTIAEAFRKAGKEWDDSPLATHDVKVFYMERGGMYSNLALEFNFPTFVPIELTIEKADGSSHTPLPNATFGLYNAPACGEGNQIKKNGAHVTATSDAQGHVTFSGLSKDTVYYIKELTAPTNYKQDDTVYVVKAPTSDGQPLKIYAYSEENPEEPEQGLDNILNYEKRFTSIEFIKVDEDEPVTSADRLLENAEFTLYTDKECKTIAKNKDGTEMKAIASNAQGKVTFSQMLAPATYYFKETKEPDGYIRNNDLFKVVLDETGSFEIYKVEGTQETLQQKVPQGASEQYVEIPNKPKNQKTSVTVQKEWSDGNKNHKLDSIKVQLYKQYVEIPEISYTVKVDPWKNGTPGDGEVTAVIRGDDGSQYPVRLNSANGWSQTIEHLAADVTYSVVNDDLACTGNVGMVEVAETVQDGDGNYTTTLNGWKQEKITLTVVADYRCVNGYIENQKPNMNQNGNSGHIYVTITGSDNSSRVVQVYDSMDPNWQNSIEVDKYANCKEVVYTATVSGFNPQNSNPRLSTVTVYGENQISGASGTFHLIAYGAVPNNAVRVIIDPTTPQGNWSVSGNLYTTYDYNTGSNTQEIYLNGYNMNGSSLCDIYYSGYNPSGGFFLEINDSFDNYEVLGYQVGNSESLSSKYHPTDHPNISNKWVVHIPGNNNLVVIKLRPKTTAALTGSRKLMKRLGSSSGTVTVTEDKIVSQGLVLNGATAMTDSDVPGEATACVELNESNNWTYTWTGLSTLGEDPTDHKTKNIVYYVKEVEVNLKDDPDASLVQAEYEYVYNEENKPESGVKSVKVKNTVYGKSSLEVTKAWYTANGSTPYIPDANEQTITFDVYQHVDGQTDTVFRSNQTLTYDNGWPVVTIEDLPDMVKDGEELKPATYYVKETSPAADGINMTTYYKGEGARVTDPSEAAGSDWETIINVNGSKNLKITKRWFFDDGTGPVETNEPTEKTVYFKLKKTDGTFYSEGSTDIFRLDWDEEQGWPLKEFVINDPLELCIVEVDAAGNPIEDANRNGSIEVNYTDADGDSVDESHPFRADNGGIYTINNMQKRTSLYAEKIWWGTNRFNLAGDKVIWFELRRVQTDGNSIIQGTDELVQEFTMNESGHWVKYFQDLIVAPFSENTAGQVRYYQYYVKELGFKEENTYVPVSNNLKIYYQSRGGGTWNETEYKDYSAGKEYPEAQSGVYDWLSTNDQVLGVKSWLTSYDGTGTLGVFNSSFEFRDEPINVQKKWFKQSGSSWEDVSAQAEQNNLTVEIQLMQEATFPADGPGPVTTVRTEYGNTFIIGKTEVIKQSDSYVVEKTPGTDWKYTIPARVDVSGSQRRQLPAKGPFKYEGNDYVANFRYYVSEYKVFDGDNNDITSQWSAACFSTDGQSFEIDNRKTTDLTAHKKWKEVSAHFIDTNVKAVLYKVYRQEGTQSPTDLTDLFGRDPSAYGLTASDVEILTETTGEGEEESTSYDTYLKLVPASSGGTAHWADDTALTVEHLAAYVDNYSDLANADRSNWEKYTYWIEECKYIDGSDKVHDISDLYGTGDAPVYGTSVNGAAALPGINEEGTAACAHITLEAAGKTHMQMINTARGLIEIHKQWQDKDRNTIDAWQDKAYFKLQQIRKLASNENTVLDPIDYKVDGVLKVFEMTPVDGEWTLVADDLPLAVTEEGQTYNCYYRVVELDKLTDENEAYAPTQSVVYASNEGTDSDLVPVNVTNVKVDIAIQIIKTDNAATPEKLSGAKFRLSRKVGEHTFHIVDLTGLTNGEFTIEDADEGVTLTGLPAGIYQLEEILAPNGYVNLLSPIVFEITSDSRVVEPGELTEPTGEMFTFEYDSTGSKPKEAISVKNEPGVELPNSGGPGAKVIYILGSLLTIASGFLLLHQRRRIRT